MIIASIDLAFGFTVFLVLLPIAVLIQLACKTVKNDDELQAKVKDVAKKKGQEVLVKGIEWLLKKK